MTLIKQREDIFEGDQDSFLIKKMRQVFELPSKTEAPPFPRQIQFETTNICNHSCSFCAYTLMQRKKRSMNEDLFRRLCKEAYDLGAREIGLFSGAEPLTCKNLYRFISYAHEIGYEYSYISTNGIVGGQVRLKEVIDSGIRSIKFSVNGGTRESYAKVHKSDDFEQVLENIKFVSQYRENIKHQLYLSVSFVESPESVGTFDNLKGKINGLVDEVLFYRADNQSGQLDGFSKPIFENCPLPFNKAHITVEGYLRGCCNDYENLLAIEDLNKVSLKDAWSSKIFRSFRQLHIGDQLEGTLCGRCIRGNRTPAIPLNANLSGVASPVRVVKLAPQKNSFRQNEFGR